MSQEIQLEIENLLNEREEATKTKAKRAESATKKKKVKKLTKKEQQILDMARVTFMPREYETIWTEEQLKDMLNFFKDKEYIAVDTETLGVQSFKDDIVGFSIYTPTKGFYVPIQHRDDINMNPEKMEEYRVKKEQGEDLKLGRDYINCLPRFYISSMMKPLLEDRSKKYIGHNCKFDSHILRNWLNIDIRWFYDTMIGQALLDENQSKRLKDMAPFYLKVEADTFGALFGKTTFDKVPLLMTDERTGNLASYYAIKDTHLTYDMFVFQMKHLNHPRLAKIKALMFNIEMTFLQIVVEAEARGVLLDKDYLVGTVAPQLNSDVEELRRKIWNYTGEINLNSPIQLSTAMYGEEGLNLPRINDKKPDSTDKKTLAKLVTFCKAVLKETDNLVSTVLGNSSGTFYGVEKQVHAYIYGKKLGRKSKAEVIEILTDVCTAGLEVGTALLEFRSKVKLATAFADKLPNSVVEGRIHTSFNSVGTKTGRMSCSEPNLQQVPAKVGGLIRNAFVADDGRLLVSIDFSGQELRVLAHISKDPVLLDIFLNGGDVHSMTATGMWNRKHPETPLTYEQFQKAREISDTFRDADGKIDEHKLSEEGIAKAIQEEKIDGSITDPTELRRWVEIGYLCEKVRKDAKIVNFGIIYGMSELGLADTLEITEEEAKEYIAGYFDAYPGVKAWMEREKKNIDKVQFVETALGRKRRLYPEMTSGKWWFIEKAHRMGVNAIIQGTSADMTKLASIKLQPLLKELDAHILLWVHDEIIFDCPEEIGMDNLRRMADIMCTALPLDCGLKSDIEAGKKWGQKMSEDDIRDLFEGEDD